jgi:hypothetical protein
VGRNFKKADRVLRGYGFVTGSVKQCVMVRSRFSDKLLYTLDIVLLKGNVNTQNNSRSANNPRQMHMVPLHDTKAGVWCAVSATSMIGSVFLSRTLNESF